MSAASDWLTKLKSEPWYQAVEAQFAGKNIADPLWQSTLYVEDQSLDPSVRVLDHYKDGTPAGYSTGLFQLNENGVGAGQSVATLTDPVANAAIAANQMAKRLQLDGTSSADLATQLQSIEKAGWNGSLDQNATRQAALGSIVAASGGFNWSAALNPLDPKYWTGGSKSGPTSVVTGDANGNTPTGDLTGAITGATKTAQNIAIEVTVGALFLALIAGGFAIAAAPDSVSIGVPA